jgi:PAS domain S-box-containing protein
MLAGDVYRLLEGTADAAFVTTLEGEICFWNAAAESLLGYSRSDVLNKTCEEVLKGEGALGTPIYSGISSILDRAARTVAIPPFDLEVTTRCGERKWISVSTIVFEDSRSHRRLIAQLGHDISRRKKMEQMYEEMFELSKRIVSLGEKQCIPAPIEPLTEQELRILALFSKAKNSVQVAKELNITAATLRNHLHAINQKLRTHSRLEAVLHAMMRELI